MLVRGGSGGDDGGSVGDADGFGVGGASEGAAELGGAVGDAVGGTTHCTVGETRPRAGSHAKENVPELAAAAAAPGVPPSPSGY